MAKIVNIQGATTTYTVDLTGNENLQIQNLVINVDTTISRTIILPSIENSAALLGLGLMHIYIYDATGNAAVNNIVVTPYIDDNINNAPISASFLINVNNVTADIIPISSNHWVISRLAYGWGLP